ncbi:MAG: methionyl-tRNA formyltransferase [Archangiaceae bacterium]|nr:methionyl-tRNA formyltransferase [Archangiaceae bacterium]
MGTPEFAAVQLRACFALGEVVAVVTQPDKPRGRGQEVSASPVKALALEKNVPVLQPVKLRGTPFARELQALDADVAIVAAYGKILPQDVLDTPRHGCLNVHGSLLPRFRGAAPIQWAIASGDAKTGVCLMKMDAGMDTGPVIARGEVPIAPDETSPTLYDKLAVLGARLLTENVGPYLAGQRPLEAQPTEGVVMAPMLKKEDGRLDFTRPAVELERRLRGFTPWPGLYTTYQGQGLKLLAVRVGSGSGKPGEVLSAGPDGLELACAEGSLVVTQLQPEGKRAMNAAGFLSSRKLDLGTAPFS